MRNYLIAGAVSLASLSGGVVASCEPEPVACQEDDPCWDCATMGNGLCGPLLAYAEPHGLVVTDANGRPVGVVGWNMTDATSTDKAYQACQEAADEVAESDLPSGASPYLTEVCRLMVDYLD